MWLWSSATDFPGHILPDGVLTSDDMDMGQKQLGLFATFHLAAYWRYTRDTRFVRWPPHTRTRRPSSSANHLPLHRADGWGCTSSRVQAAATGYPVLRGIGLFWQCWLKPNVSDAAISAGAPHNYNDLKDCDNELCAPSGKVRPTHIQCVAVWQRPCSTCAR